MRSGSACPSAGEPGYPGLPGSDRQCPTLTGRSGMQRARPSLVAHDSCHPVTARTVQGMARVRSGQAPASPYPLWPEGVQGLRRSRVGPEDRFCEAVRNDLRVPLTVEGHPPDTKRAIPGLSLDHSFNPFRDLHETRDTCREHQGGCDG